MKKADKSNLEQIQLLLSFAKPERLRKTVTLLLTRYIANTPPEMLKPAIAEDVEFLLNFIDNIHVSN